MLKPHWGFSVPRSPAFRRHAAWDLSGRQGVQFSHPHQGRGASEKSAAACLPFRPSRVGLPSAISPAIRGVCGGVERGLGPHWRVRGQLGTPGVTGGWSRPGGGVSRAWWVMSHCMEPGDPRPRVSVHPCPHVLQRGPPGPGVVPALPSSSSSLPAPSSLVSTFCFTGWSVCPGSGSHGRWPRPGPGRGLLGSQLAFL